MMTNLEYYFESITDYRRPAGRRYSLSKLLVAFTLGVMSGNQGYRELSRFIKHNREELSQSIGWSRQQTPSHETLRTILTNINFNQVNQAFMVWIANSNSYTSGEWLAIDGKALRSTVTEYSKDTQNFINMVSAFSHDLGCVVAQHPMENKEESEINAVCDLIEKLDRRGFVLTLDAIHAQKKQLS